MRPLRPPPAHDSHGPWSPWQSSCGYAWLIGVEHRVSGRSEWRRSCPHVEDVTGRAEGKMREQTIELRHLLLDADVVTEAMMPRHLWPRLAGIELPRMEVEHHRPPFPDIDILDTEARQREGRQPEIATPSHRNVHSQHSGGADRKLDQALRPLSPDFIGDAWRVGLSVSVVEYRVGARVVTESLFEQDLVGAAMWPIEKFGAR
jgi:hypothetical protein